MIDIDHADIVVTHLCNNNCAHCIDKYVNQSNNMVTIQMVQDFLSKINTYTDKQITVLLLGGEPTTAKAELLIDIANLVHSFSYKITMSTNGKLKDKIIHLLPYFDSIQITINNQSDIDFWKPYADKINIKLAGDNTLTLEKLNWFFESTTEFYQKSISMYFTPDFVELCHNNEIWQLFDTLDWTRNGSYMYTFWNGIRIKKCIHGETNIVDEPTIPKLYPNGNYNKTWLNEEMDDYIRSDKHV